MYTGHIAWHAEIHRNRPDLPWLLMLHGFMGSGQVFSPLLEPLSRFCNPVTLDLPGHGKSGGSDQPEHYRTERLVADLSSILDRLRLSPLYLYGYSMGGRLALQVVLHQGEGPAAPAGLILESTHPGPAGKEERSRRVQLDEERAAAIGRGYPDFVERWQKLPLFSAARQAEGAAGTAGPVSGDPGRKAGAGGRNTPGAEQIENAGRRRQGREPDPVRHPESMLLERLYATVAKNQNPAWMAACLRGFGTGRMPPAAEKLDRLNLPVLLLAGRRDPKFARLHNRMAQTLPRCTSRTVEEAAHRIHVDQPGAFLQEIEQFIRKQTT